MIDNYKQISELLEWEEGCFFMVSVYKRKKDQPSNTTQKSDNILIKDYFIKSPKHFEKIYLEIQELCYHFKARAYIRLNKIFWNKAAMETLLVIAEYIQQENFHNVKAAFSTACGRRCYDKNKKWIIDIDGEEIDLNIFKEKLNEYLPRGNKIIAEIPTINGIHLITKPFDLQKFKIDYPQIDVHKNNPTLLYFNYE